LISVKEALQAAGEMLHRSETAADAELQGKKQFAAQAAQDDIALRSGLGNRVAKPICSG
jgi:hypothetical protein